MRVKFHLPDFAEHFKFNMLFIAMLKNCGEYFRDGVEIASVYGAFPQSIWNGGRTQYGICDKSFVSGVTKSFNKEGIPLRFTFTNPMLQKKHLDDSFCNMVLSIADNGMNGAIVVSPILEKYIRTNYPNYKLTSSTCKRLNTLELLNEELERNYDIVVLDYDFNNKWDTLEKINHKEKCEILVNACCTPECPNRSQHYKSIGLQQIAYCEHIKKHPNTDFNLNEHTDLGIQTNFNCPYMFHDAIDIRKLGNHITPEDIYEKYVPMGFNQFKIEGRTTSIFNLIENYMYYMIKPEFIDKARLMLLSNLEKNGIIKTDRIE